MQRRTIRETGRETDSECVECGLASRGVQLTLGSPDASSAPGPEWLRSLAEQRTMAMYILDDVPFPLYGLDDRWMGPRSLGGSGSSGDTVGSVSLAHGHLVEQIGPEIRVETERDERFPPTMVLDLKARSLVRELAFKTGELRDDVRAAAFQGDRVVDPLAPWDEVELAVDEVPTPFRSLTAGEHWVAATVVGEFVVTVTARSWPLDLTGLVTVDDLAPYREGTAQQIRDLGGP